jgi:hypothetical protein
LTNSSRTPKNRIGHVFAFAVAMAGLAVLGDRLGDRFMLIFKRIYLRVRYLHLITRNPVNTRREIRKAS